MDIRKTGLRVRLVGRVVGALVRTNAKGTGLPRLLRRGLAIVAREGLNGIRGRMATLAMLTAPPPPPPVRSYLALLPEAYEAWHARFGSLNERDIRAARQHLEALSLPELLILLLPSREDLPSLSRIAATWNGSIHAGWRAAIVPPAGLDDAEEAALRAVADADPRLSVLRDPAELARLRAARPWTLLCLGGVSLNPLSAYFFLEAAERTGADILYADHDVVDEEGRHATPSFKPQFSPAYLSRFNYIGDCLLLSRDVPLDPADILGGTSSDPAGFDTLVRRLCEGRRVEHVPFILSHVAGEKPRLPSEPPSYPDHGPGVSIVIPTRDGLHYLQPCVESILSETSYDPGLVDIAIIDNGSTDPATLAWMEEIAARPNVDVHRYPHPFNFAAINNFGAARTRGEILLFLNNDTLVLDRAWLSKLVYHATRPGTGVVGAKLLFPDGTVQHGGCAAGGNIGTVSHLLMNAPADSVAATDHTRELSLVTGACWAVRRAVFEQVGGFDDILRITWNDVKFCLDCMAAGYRNMYVADPLLTHDESKTRGHDGTPEKLNRYYDEGHYTRQRYAGIFHDDPSYNPNLSVLPGAFLAEPPRVRRPWVRDPRQKRRVLVLSSVYRFGFGVSIVIQQQVRKLVELGYDVVIGGPKGENELPFPGCERAYLQDSRDAARYAWENDVSLIVAHTPPYFEIPTFIGGQIPVLSYDYGEPPAALFPDPVRSYLLDVERQKRSVAALTTVNAVISQAVKDETLNDDAVVLGLANSHLRTWSDDLRPRRDDIRARHGWNDAFVVLTVCRFSPNERQYKGLDKVAQIARQFPYMHPEKASEVIWVLAGAGSAEDVREVEALGFTVFPNLPDDALVDLYLAADAYLSFSRWEGYNLGIGQSLALGLPTLASDIPAHREFPIHTTDSTLAACRWLANVVVSKAKGARREATIFEWETSVTRFAEVLGDMIRRTEKPPPRSGDDLQRRSPRRR